MGGVPIAVQRITDKLADSVEPERREDNFFHFHSGLADRTQRPRERVGRTHLVVAISADQQQMVQLRVRDQVFKKVERCCIQPLQIIEE